MAPTIGGMAPPLGTSPNFVDPYSLQKYNVITQAVCFTSSTIFVSARLFTKIRLIPPLRSEDYTCLAAWLGLLAYGMLDLVSDAYGNGVHLWNVPQPHAVRWAQLKNIQQIIYGPIILITKISILLLYSRLFAPHRKSVTYVLIQTLLHLNVLFYTAITIVKIFQCTPRRKIWEQAVPGHCINLAVLLYVTGTVNTCSDIAILILPLGIIWRLQLPTNQKIGVSAAFTAALLAPIASILRLESSIKGAASKDVTYNVFAIALWTQAEITIGVICSCLPTFPALYRHYVPNLSSSRSSGRRRGVSDQSTKPSKHSVLPSRYQHHDDPHLLREEYLELDGVSRDENPATAFNGPVTRIEGGIHVNTNWEAHRRGDQSVDNDCQIGHGGGITKTVRLEAVAQGRPPFRDISTGKP